MSNPKQNEREEQGGSEAEARVLRWEQREKTAVHQDAMREAHREVRAEHRENHRAEATNEREENDVLRAEQREG